MWLCPSLCTSSAYLGFSDKSEEKKGSLHHPGLSVTFDPMIMGVDENDVHLRLNLNAMMGSRSLSEGGKKIMRSESISACSLCIEYLSGLWTWHLKFSMFSTKYLQASCIGHSNCSDTA